jgi:2-(3-amino-3-carboxypropyl)histidine synthase
MLESRSSEPVSDLIDRIREKNAKRVALQFPEGLKRRAFGTARELRAAGFGVVISGDPCYGSCDLALETLQMVDLLVHFGHAPVEEREHVLYEYVPLDFEPESLEGVVSLIRKRRIGLVTTVQHAHLVREIAAFLASRGIECVVGKGGSRTPLDGQVLGCSYAAARAAQAEEILFVGTGVFHPLGVQLATGARVIAFDPYTGSAEVVDAAPLLKKRFVRIEKARAAESIGVLLSLKSGQQRRELAERLVNLSEHAVIVTMREISPEGLLNLGFDCYVNTACPRLAYDDQMRFPAPVLSPPEFEIACGVRSWDEYAIDEIE